MNDGKIRQPCANCPWRVDAPRGHWDPSHFFEIWRNCQDDGAHEMLCHKSTVSKPLPCQGWARVIGFAAIGIRLAVMRGALSAAEVADRSGPKLFRTFATMLRANGLKLPHRNRFIPTPRKP